MPKPFFYRIDAAEFVAAVLQIPDGQHKQWVTQLALDMVSGVGTMDFSKKIIEEVDSYRKKQAEAGAKGGKPKHKQPYSDPIAEDSDPIATPKQDIASSSSSTEAEEESKEKTCSEPSDSEPAYQLILKDKTFFDVSEEQVEEWEGIYTCLDVRRELSKMVQWCENTPAKRKTRGGCNKFICGWLDREDGKRDERTPPKQPNLLDEAIRSVINKNKAEHSYGRHDDDDYRIIDPEKTQQAEDYIGRLIREANGH